MNLSPASGSAVQARTRRARAEAAAVSGSQPLVHAPGCGTPRLPITFGPIVGSAEHLAVLG